MTTTEKPKICLVTPEYPPRTWGGLARMVERVAGFIASAGCQVEAAHLIFSGQPYLPLDELGQTEQVGPVTVHRLTLGAERLPPGQNTIWDHPHNLTFRQAFQALEGLQRENHYDLLVSCFLYPVGYLTGLLARREGIPHLAATVGNDLKKYAFSPDKVAMIASALDNADMVIGVSRDLIDLADALRPIKDRARVIHNAVEIPDQAWTPHDRADRFRIGFAGIFKYAKGLPYLLKALARLRETGPAEVELLGQLRPEEEGPFNELIDRLDLAGAVAVRPPVGHDRINDWLLGLDAFCLPSVSEGCPNVLLEAMACGLPCAASRVGAVGDIIEDGRSGLIVPPGDSAALAAALDRIRADRPAAATLAAAARERMNDFSDDREKRGWVEAIGDLLS